MVKIVPSGREVRARWGTLWHRTHFPNQSERRKQTLAFLRYLKEQNATVLLLFKRVSASTEVDLHFLSDGILELNHGAVGRTITILKQRGRGFRSATHSFCTGNDGLRIYPRLEPAGGLPETEEASSSWVPDIDQLLGKK